MIVDPWGMLGAIAFVLAIVVVCVGVWSWFNHPRWRPAAWLVFGSATAFLVWRFLT